MNEERFIVKFISVKNCFVYIPNNWLQRLTTQNGAIKLSYDNKEYFVSHEKSKSSGNDYLCISPTFGKCLDIKEGNEIFATWIFDPPVLTSIIVTPINYSDWEIVRLQADKIQSIMLNQINIVTPNQIIVIWLSKYLNIKLLVDSINPKFLYGKLENYTEVHVQDSPSKTTSNNTIEKIINSFNLNDKKNTDNNIDLNIYKKEKLNFIFRVCKTPKFEYLIDDDKINCELNSPHNIFIQKLELKKLFSHQDSFENTFVKIKKIHYIDKQNENVNLTLSNDNDNFDDVEIDDTVRILSIDDFLNDTIAENNFFGNIWIPELLRKKLGLQLGSKIKLEPLDVIEDPVKAIKLITSINSPLNRSKFENYIKKYSENYEILLTSGTKIYIDDEIFCITKFTDEENKYILLNKPKLQQLKITINNEEFKSKNLIIKNGKEKIEDMINMKNIYHTIFQEIFEECHMIINLSFDRNFFSYNRENILICGDIGTGKSTICKLLKQQFESYPKNIYTRFIDCKKLKESIINYSSDSDENSPDAINQWKISDAIVKLLTSYQSRYLICCISSCTDVLKLGTELRSSRGVQFFRTIIKIPTIKTSDRIEFYKLLLKNKLTIDDNIDWQYFGIKTEGWVAQDLVDLAEKTVFFVWKSNLKTTKSNSELYLMNDNLTLALEKSKALSLHGVSLYSNKENSWSNIGGLDDVKKILIQLLQWPLIYPELYLNSPTKHQPGILLYGMPGTGKTIIAGAIANECGLNFINIKGPELLSKYIGASEESVRKIFIKAQLAKPCVLFFDEFDSFAPRRGHDSTGVTDRVVNQLLTQFDGVEGRDGVAIVAATSRPDLLDPALLRPGRLDKSIYCPLPNELEREKILQTLCKSQSINTNNLDLTKISKLTNGFTGADLNAILTQAKLDSLEKIWSKTTAPIDKQNFNDITITQDGLINAFELTQPSLSTIDVIKYNNIYKKFSNGNNFIDEILNNQKSTLA
ncbi:peroxisome biogenesis factor 1 isoform X2 [Aphidius gifuensis]|uniref:peroxisome biogenesis factor 1 isoform X2 n=1 Tax=Aphidius gifuensis TaxID=684658 RepID=UPI001CDB807B|nr:peroxisome biogenesis factor 1 isoform X2 [Aphidius gifuensis]